MTDWIIREAKAGDREAVIEMRTLLWPGPSTEEHAQEFDTWLTTGLAGTMPLTNLVAEDADGKLVGFLEVDLRSHADGCDPATPSGYVEGWYVHEPWRGRGVGAALMRGAEAWARTHGCVEMASDALVDNTVSQSAHQALGFSEVDRCVHYRKQL